MRLRSCHRTTSARWTARTRSCRLVGWLVGLVGWVGWLVGVVGVVGGLGAAARRVAGLVVMVHIVVGDGHS